MSRFLVVVPPFTGHINPLVAVAEQLRARGHDVSWCGDAATLSRSLPGPWPVHPCRLPPMTSRPVHLRGYAALKHLWDEVLLPLADSMVPGVRQAVRDTRPDVVVVDQQALAGALVAEEAGLLWATSASTSADLIEPFAMTPRVRDWLAGRLSELAARHGVAVDVGDLRLSRHRVIAFTTAALAGGTAARVRFVGPARRAAGGGADFPWERIAAGRTTVLVSMGTANTEVTGDFLRECAAAMRARPQLQAVFADPGDHLRGHLGEFVRERWVPVPELLPHVSAVVCHAGHNTVCESLAYGVPLVVAPIRDDQPVVADQVATTGAGVRLRFTHSRAEHIGSALDRVLGDPAFTAAAARIRDSFAAAGGASAAASTLEGLAAEGHRSRATRA